MSCLDHSCSCAEHVKLNLPSAQYSLRWGRKVFTIPCLQTFKSVCGVCKCMCMCMCARALHFFLQLFRFYSENSRIENTETFASCFQQIQFPDTLVSLMQCSKMLHYFLQYSAVNIWYTILNQNYILSSATEYLYAVCALLNNILSSLIVVFIWQMKHFCGFTNDVTCCGRTTLVMVWFPL